MLAQHEWALIVTRRAAQLLALGRPLLALQAPLDARLNTVAVLPAWTRPSRGAQLGLLDRSVSIIG